MTTVSVRCGEADLEVRIPADREVERLEPPTPGEPRPVGEAVAPLLPTIARAADGARSVTIVVPDDSRPFPVATLMPGVLDALHGSGVAVGNVRILVGTGLHRAMGRDALSTHLGPDVVAHYAVRNHDARDPATLVECGTLDSGVPVALAREAVEADLRVFLGSSEPHQYQGFSGGDKALGIGGAGEALIAHTHGRAFLTDERVRPGLSPGNPFRAAVTEAARCAGPAVALNLIPGPDETTTYGAAAGDPGDVWTVLAHRARRVYGSVLSRPADVILAGVPTPKSRNLYQASRAATNLVLCDHPALAVGGTIVLFAPCEDGVGDGEGERRFGRALRERGTAILTDRQPIRPGEQRAFMVARVLGDHRIVLVGARNPDNLDSLGIEIAGDVETMLADLPGRILVVPDALHVLPEG